MGLTNFPGGITSFGNPVFGGGSMQVPLVGSQAKAFFVDGARGSDGNRGTDFRKPLKTVSKAYSLTTDKAGDVIYLMNDGNTSGTSRESATLTWANDNTHLIGWCAPTVLSQRARISTPSGQTTIVTPQLLVSGNGNIFSNISLFEGTDQDSIDSESVRVTGSRNYFHNVAMMNMGEPSNAHAGDEASSANLKIDGGAENTFDGCFIGLDTAARSTTNANVELVGNTARNTFRNCIFPAFADNSGVLFIKVDGNGDIDRWVLFDNCTFINVDNSAATTMTVAINAHSACGGHIIIKDCSLMGATNWVASANTKVRLTGSVPTVATTGVSVQGRS